VRAFAGGDGVIVPARDATEARAISDRLSRQATHDEFTGLISTGFGCGRSGRRMPFRTDYRVD